VTNMAAGLSKGKLSHEEVTATADRIRDDFARLLGAIIKVLGSSS